MAKENIREGCKEIRKAAIMSETREEPKVPPYVPETLLHEVRDVESLRESRYINIYRRATVRHQTFIALNFCAVMSRCLFTSPPAFIIPPCSLCFLFIRAKGKLLNFVGSFLRNVVQ